MDFINPQNRILKDSIRYTNNYEPVARIVVIGVGGAGNNALNRMIDDGVIGVEYVAVNTDVQDLKLCKADRKIAIGEKVTGGRGCGAMPELGESAANESKEAIRQILREDENQRKADMVFITCGMGGGTGTGAAPVIASIAKEEGILTVAVVTKPFRFEGKVRMAKALVGIDKITPNVDTMITIANDKLLNIVDVNDGFKEAFEKADEILKQSIRGITDLINLPALVNLDFADVSTVMRGKGLAHIAIGEGTGENKVMTANGEYEAKAIILAIGAENRKLNIAGESLLVGKGVSYCATCDGNFYKGKDVAVVGGGNTALEDAIYLADIANKVYIIHRKDSFRAEESYQDELRNKKNVEYVMNANATFISR